MTIQDRLNYWRNHDLKSGWTQSAGGPCCDKCRMTAPKDPLQALCGCCDPFQIKCECHIPARRAFRDSMVRELEALCAPPEALRSEMHRCLGFAFEMKGGVRTWPVWLCSMETVKEAVAKGWLSDSQLELLIPRMGMSQVVYRLTDEGGAEFMRHHYSVPSPLRQKP